MANVSFKIVPQARPIPSGVGLCLSAREELIA
jgi:hypothetical protein